MFELLSTIHWGALAKIVAIDLTLGIDNAIVIAMAVMMLAENLRNKAIIAGTAGAIIARVALLFVGFWLITIPFLKLFAGGYLIYLAWSMVKNEDEETHKIKQSASFWGAVWVITVSDLMFSLDNVVALVGAAEGTGDHAFGYTVFGIVLSIPIIIFASKYLVNLLDKFPILVNLGAALIAYVGIEMAMKENWVRVGEILSDHNTQIGVALTTAVLVALYSPIKGWYHKRQAAKAA